MIRINLLPTRVSKKREAGKQQLILLASAVALVLIGNFWWNHSRSSAFAESQAKLARTRGEIAQLEKIIGKVKNIRTQQNALKEKLAVLDKLKAGREGPVRMLDELATIIPKRVWLRKMEEKDGTVTMEASAITIDDVSAFLAALKKARYFVHPDLKKTSSKAEGRFKVVDFTVVVGVNYSPGVEIAAATAPRNPGRDR